MVSKRRWTVRRIRMVLQSASAGVLVLLTLAVAAGLLADPQFGRFKAYSARRNAITLEGSGGRAPASAVAIDETTTHEVEAFSIIDLDCGGPVDFRTDTSAVRLRGQSCNGLPIQSSSIINRQPDTKNTLWTATVFLKGSQFTTDLIHLSPGRNVIEISHEFGNGEPELAEFVVEKR